MKVKKNVTIANVNELYIRKTLKDYLLKKLRGVFKKRCEDQLIANCKRSSIIKHQEGKEITVDGQRIKIKDISKITRREVNNKELSSIDVLHSHFFEIFLRNGKSIKIKAERYIKQEDYKGCRKAQTECMKYKWSFKKDCDNDYYECMKYYHRIFKETKKRLLEKKHRIMKEIDTAGFTNKFPRD